MYIDTHTHIYLQKFEEDREACMRNAFDIGVDKLYLPNIDVSSIKQITDLVKEYPNNCIPMMGLHPCSVDENYKSTLKIIKDELYGQNIYKAVGEIGIDLYWSREYESEQIESFATQIEWALELNLPIVIHSRDSIDECIDIVSQYQQRGLTGIFHCFSGSIEQASKIQDLGFLMGIGGVVTFKNSGLDKVVAEIPLDCIVLETDAPYLAPHPFRGKRNESKYIPIIAEKIASIKNINIEEIARVTTENAKRIFKA